MKDKEIQQDKKQDRHPCFDCPSHGIDKQCACALMEELERGEKEEECIFCENGICECTDKPCYGNDTCATTIVASED